MTRESEANENPLKALSGYLRDKRIGCGLAAVLTLSTILSGCGPDYKELYFKEKQKQADSYKQQNETLRGKISDYESKLRSIEIDNSNLKSQISTKEVENSNLKSQIAIKDQQIRTLDGRIFFTYGFAPPGYRILPSGQIYYWGSDGMWRPRDVVRSRGGTVAPGYIWVGTEPDGTSIWVRP